MTDDEIFQAIRLRVETGQLTDAPDAERADPASEEALDHAEQVIGYPLPPLLRRLYAEVANGGFGPFTGVEGVDGGYSEGVGMLEDYVRTPSIPSNCPWRVGSSYGCPVSWTCTSWPPLNERIPGDFPGCPWRTAKGFAAYRTIGSPTR